MKVADAVFSPDPMDDPDVLDVLYREVGGFELTPGLVAGSVVDLVVASGLATSRSEARRAVEQGGVTVNGQRMALDTVIPVPLRDRYLVVRLGRKRLTVGRVGPA